MVFESIVTDVLNRFLGDYIENLDSKQLKIGIWGGDVVLSNLILKQSALNDLDLPVQTVFGRLEKLVLKIPWKNLYGEAVEATIEGLYLLVQPNNQVLYDAEKEEKRCHEAKQAELQKIDEAKKREKEVKKTDDTFVEKLVTQIIKNVQLSIKNIHIRYEDSQAENPYGMGITLSSLKVQTTDENWVATVVSDMVKKIYKIVSLEGLSVYWNCNPDMYSNMPTEDLKTIFQNDIASRDHIPNNYNYILRPINSASRLKLNPKPELDEPQFEFPKAHAELVIEQLSIGITKCQYRDLIAFADSMSFQSRGLPFRKYRPSLQTYRGHYKKWWLFAYTCVLETQVRKKKSEWDWNHMHEHRQMCREYGEAYKCKLTSKKVPPNYQKCLETAEKQVDLFNLVLVRQRIELEVERMDKKREVQEKKGWFSGWWNKGSSDQDDADIANSANILSKFQMAMTADEKEKLFKAIDYKENMIPTLFPSTYIDTVVRFHLKEFEISVKNDLRDMSDVVKSKLKNVKCNIERRPVKDGLKVAVFVENFTVFGTPHNDIVPEIISSKTDEQTALLDVLFEMNPTESSCGQKLHVTAKPIRILFDTNTVFELMDTFKLPSNSALEQLSQATSEKLNDIKEMSATGLQHAIDKHISIDLLIDMAAPYVIIPYGGSFTGAENVIVLNLGKIYIKSIERKGDVANLRQMYREGVDKEEMLNNLISQSYEKFVLQLTNVHIMVAQGDEDYLKYIFESSDVSPMHLLRPLNLNMTLETCLIPDDPKLPLTKITAEMPVLNVNVTDTRLLLLLALVNSIVNELNKDGDTVETIIRATSSASMHKIMELADKKSGQVLKVPEKSKTVQMTMLEAKFELKGLEITLATQEMLSSPINEILTFKVNSLKCNFAQQTFNMEANVFLDSIYMDQNVEGALRNIISSESHTGSSLFKVKLLKVNKKSPEFIEKYRSCEMLLNLDFDSLKFVLNQEGLLDIIRYANAIQSQLVELSAPPPRFANAGRRISEGSAKLLSPPSMIEKSGTRVKITDDIQFKLVANLVSISVMIERNNESISSFAINGISSEIIIKQAYTKITACLRNINIQDLNVKTIHRTILFVEPNEKAIDTDILLYNTDIVKASCNISIQASLGRIKLIFVNSYLSNILSFLNNFQAAQQAIQEASNKAAQAAKENMHSVYEKATKVSLNVNLNAPEIVIPESSKSLHGLLVDLGHITITNKFNELTIRNEAGHHAIIDELHLSLEELKIERVKIDTEFVYQHRIPLLDPLSFSLVVNRNLSQWYTAVPSIDIDGNIDTIELKLGRPDYETIMKIVSGNLAEGATDMVMHQSGPVADRLEIAEDKTSGVVVKSVASRHDDESEINTMFRWNLVMKCFKINLYTAAPHRSTAQMESIEYCRIGLAEFSLDGLSVRGCMLSNSTISNSLLLVNCRLVDSRPGMEDKINCCLSRREDSNEAPAGSMVTLARNMIDVTFQQKHSDTFVDVRVYSFTFILSVEYLLKLSLFFATPEDQQTKQVAVKNVENKPKEKVEASVNMLTLTVKVEKPYIILVEHLDSIDTRALILNCEVLLKVRLTGERQNINGTIKDMQMYTCVFDPLEREATKNSFLAPITISLAGSTPESKGLHIEIFVSDICVSVSLYTIELISKILNTLSGSSSVELNEVDTLSDHSNTWEIQKIKEDDYWFLKSDTADDALKYTFSTLNLSSKNRKGKLNELCILNVPVMLLTLEAGIGNKTIPMLVMETRFEGKINDWSTQMVIEASLSIQMGYYNSLLALWEPLIEPLTEVDEKGTRCKPWEIKLEVSMNDMANEDTSLSPVDTEPIEMLCLQPAMSIDVTSTSNLELTVTKTCLDVLSSLGKLFSDAINSKEMHYVEKSAPYKVINASGIDIELLLGTTEFTVLSQDTADVIRLEKDTEVMLDLKKSQREKNVQSLVSILSNMDKPPQERFLKISVPEMHSNLELPVIRADTRYFKLQDKKNWGLVSSVKVDNGVTIITICSILQIHNDFNTAIDLYYMRNTGNELEYISSIKPGSSIYVPLNAVYSQTSELFFSIANYSVTSTPYVWKDLQLNVVVSKNLICFSKDDPQDLFVIRAVGEMSQIYYENTLKHTMASTIYNIHLKPAVILKNCLPIEIHLCVRDVVNENVIQPGHQLEIPNVEPGKSYIVIRLPSYLEKEWSCRREIQMNPQQFTVWTFESHDSPNKVALDLGMHILQLNGTVTMSLYCPFWMINKTGLVLGYRSTDENLNILHHPPFFKGPILFSFNAKNFFGKKKACVRIEQGEWSEKFSIDVAGSSGVVVCKNKGKLHQIGVSNRLTYNGLTKQITFTPYYVIINHSPLTIECQELDRPGDPWLSVAPKSCCALWPCSEQEDKLIKVRMDNTDEITAPFLITESHTTLLKLKNKYGGINVDIQMTEGATYINLTLYDTGMAPALIINHTKHTMNIWEKESVQIRKLLPSHNLYYTWDNPSADRVLVWEGGYGKELENDLRMDGVGDYPISEDSVVYWTSFLDGMQRVLLFTTDSFVITNVQASKQFEQVDKEITVSIYGLGLSLVNNLKRQEIMYIGIASTGIIWETSKFNSNRYKQVSTKDNLAMERAYQLHLLKNEDGLNVDYLGTVVDDRNEVNFQMMTMMRPHKRKIRRQFQTGLWFQMKTSPHQMQIHAKVNRLQIDNQLYDCTFPVLLAPVPPPKSIALNDAHKPFAELSIVQLLIKNSQIRQFKYFKILIQEFHVKVDLSFINAIMEIFDTSVNSEQEELDSFLIDCRLVEEPLYMLVSTQSLQEQKSFYDLLHFSPLKIHVSFSMSASGSSQGIGNIPVFLSVLLQGIGVTLTDLQDVVFKLAYFEREYSFLTQRQLVQQTTTHYLGQTVKQLYVLVLGLDVIGNPYGLVLGITKGVEDLFYEPFQGAIQGPGEFAEGLMLGVASLFGHTVGGAAGAVSRITGAMGKGIAALTFDKEYQRKRRDQINKKPATVHEGLARGGKGLVMGVVDGVTGVFTKPISGAKEQGVGGFFKGLGKGAVGLVTRPTAGVMDFASTSFETVKRVTDMGHGYVNRLRTPRFVQADCCVKPYNETLAYGNTLLCELEKGKYYTTDIYSTHYIIVDKKEVLLLSNKRMAYIVHNELFGGWQVDWTYTWQEIDRRPSIVTRGVQVFVDTKRKRFFQGNDNGKVIIMSDPKMCENLVAQIISHMNTN